MIVNALVLGVAVAGGAAAALLICYVLCRARARPAAADRVGVCVVLDRAPVDDPPLTPTAGLAEVRGRRVTSSGTTCGVGQCQRAEVAGDGAELADPVGGGGVDPELGEKPRITQRRMVPASRPAPAAAGPALGCESSRSSRCERR